MVGFWAIFSFLKRYSLNCISKRVERAVGGGIGMGNTCKPMAISFQCMTKFTTNKKKLYFNKHIWINKHVFNNGKVNGFWRIGILPSLKKTVYPLYSLFSPPPGSLVPDVKFKHSDHYKMARAGPCAPTPLWWGWPCILVRLGQSQHMSVAAV